MGQLKHSVWVIAAAMATLGSRVAERATRLAHALDRFFSVVGIVPPCVLSTSLPYIGFIAIPCLKLATRDI